ncbi:hypothetical protein R4P64_30165 [Rhodococcus sp. IEGM 1366]|uniref:hypothetical protein n=1 Tax=Rhodococcus sp. IEGM 1366 TaxID=3082223 RepID=UPI0029556845|nr:hypothetical protein [Rhodococcus sp. IEGM 1366]MDV8070794.1 hypothetical protein [Rhodococcus sp. IEGM 1366]
MRNTLVIAAAALVVSFGLTACGGDSPDPSSTTTPSASPIAVSSITPTAPVLPPSSAPAVVPITFECGDLSLYQSGTALYSDGTTGYEASCDTYVPPVVTQAPTRVLQYCDYPGTAVYTDGTYSATDPACAEMRAESSVGQNPNPGGGYPYDPEEDRNGDGVVNGYERCGVQCGKAPTSGDIQTQYGCEQGYISGPLCEPYVG